MSFATKLEFFGQKYIVFNELKRYQKFIKIGKDDYMEHYENLKPH